ncbi:hypothetical protein GCM10009853_067410 [Glycomyces scopariae]
MEGTPNGSTGGVTLPDAEVGISITFGVELRLRPRSPVVQQDRAGARGGMDPIGYRHVASTEAEL